MPKSLGSTWRWLMPVASFWSFASKVMEEVGQSEAKVFDAHLAVFGRPGTDRGNTRKAVISQRAQVRPASFCAARSEELVQRFARIPDAYLRERAIDLEDVSERVVRQLVKGQRRRAIELHEPSIVVAHNLNPSTLTQLRVRNVLGIATDLGGPTSHVAILARALHLPAVSGLSSASRTAAQRRCGGLDGNAGHAGHSSHGKRTQGCC
jgi:phosphotransferase system enzyme I (PtsI)